LFDALAGCGSDGVGEDDCIREHKGLTLGGGSHTSASCGIAFGYDGYGCGVEDDFLIQEVGEGLAGDVVGGGTKASADEYQIGTVEGFLSGISNGFDFVWNGGVAHELQANGGECCAEVLCVRIERSSAEQFAADRDEFCLIVHGVLLKMRDYLEVMNESNQSLSVDAGGHRLDVFLAGAVPEVSRSHWKSLIHSGRVLVNGASSKPNHKLRRGDEVCWSLPEDAPDEPQPEDIPVDILFEDDDVLVLNKPAGLVVHPAVGNESGTLVNALLFHDPAFEALERAGIVHRLDKDTSGVMVVGKSESAIAELMRQFKARETEKEYMALVWGSPAASGRIETLIGRHPKHRQKMAVLSEGGREAVSNFQTVEKFKETTLVQVKIETGRTHQIRVHLLHLGHPIVGDGVYGRARRNKLPMEVDRQMLHAARLEFTHPTHGKRLSFEAPLPNDMRLLIETLRNEFNG